MLYFSKLKLVYRRLDNDFTHEPTILFLNYGRKGGALEILYKKMKFWQKWDMSQVFQNSGIAYAI